MRLRRAMENRISEAKTRLHAFEQRPVMRHPDSQLLKHRQRLDRLCLDLARTTQQINQRREHLKSLQARLISQHPEMQMEGIRKQLDQLQLRLVAVVEKQMQRAQMEAFQLTRQLDALSPLKVMQRGYSLVFRYGEKQLIKSVEQVQPGNLHRIHLHDGKLNCQVWGREALHDGEERDKGTRRNRTNF